MPWLSKCRRSRASTEIVGPARRAWDNFFVNLLDARRRAPRILLDGLCGVVTGDAVQPAAMSDLSTLGLRVERPFDPKRARPIVQLELELPGIDEVIWASATVTHAWLTPMRGGGFWCRAGLKIEDTARREKKLLRDYVIETLIERRKAA